MNKDVFLINKDIYFFNNGSYGACPKVVFEKYQEWQRKMEYQPVEFFQKDLLPRLKNSRELLGNFINAKADDLTIIRNATYAANTVIKSLDLGKNDEVLVTNHEYGACINAWKFWQKEKGFKIKIIDLDIPFPDTNEIINIIKSNITKDTKVFFFSHISSFTAQLFPAKEICKLAKDHNIISVVDAAHAVGQFPLNIIDLAPDFYFSNIHKWLFAPKGTAFLYTRKELQSIVKPLITGWGWGDNREMQSGSDYIDANQFYGTNDISSFLTIPDAIDFYQDNNVVKLKQKCNSLVKFFITEANEITGKKSLYNEFSECLMMAVIEIPDKYSVFELKGLLYDKYKIEVPVLVWKDKLMLRISIQIYNTEEEVEYLLSVLRELF